MTASFGEHRLGGRATPHVLIVGTGVAGYSAALSAARAGAAVTLVAQGASLTEFGGNTKLAQGGIAAAIGAGDTPEKHAHDTMIAGAGLSDRIATQALTASGAAAVRGLIEAGFSVDRDPAGTPIMGMEGAHGAHRIVHAGEDRTGAALHAFLTDQVQHEVQLGRMELLPSRTVTRLLTHDGVVCGVELRDASGTLTTHSADAVVLATGGYAGLYPRSTNAVGVCGDGLLLAARAGAVLADLEFVQFHPTVMHGTGSLISEAVRGAGAVLRDGSGRRFMPDAHPQGDLAPRDIVSREIHRVLSERGESHVWLDATAIEQASGAGTLARRFPTITQAASALGVDWARDPIAVSPAAHYSMGGIATDLRGLTSVPGLFAAGEAAATGVHGANRLASNSLLEGLVFGARAGRAAAEFDARSSPWEPVPVTRLEQEQLTVVITSGAAAGRSNTGSFDDTGVASASSAHTTLAHTTPVATVSAAIASGLGILRHADGLRAASRVFEAAAGPAAQLASLMLALAEARTESRGAHQRSDHPEIDPAQAVRRSIRAVFAAPPTHQPSRTPHLSHATARTKEPHPC